MFSSSENVNNSNSCLPLLFTPSTLTYFYHLLHRIKILDDASREGNMSSDADKEEWSELVMILTQIDLNNDSSIKVKVKE